MLNREFILNESLNPINTGYFTTHPRVSEYVCHRHSLCSVRVHHNRKKVFEFLRKTKVSDFTLKTSSPKVLRLVVEEVNIK